MKKSLLVIALVSLSLTGAPQLRAQFTPEFSLNLKMMSGNFTRSTTIGYDSLASDTCEKTLGETSDFPPLGFKDFVLLNRDPSFHDGKSPVDYRHKPAKDSFEIDYEWDVESDDYPVTISWNPGAIPALVKHIYVVPAAAQKHVLVDLKKQSSLTITSDSELYYRDCLLLLLYNTEAFAVEEGSNVPNEFLSAPTAYPNPSSGTVHIDFVLSKAAWIAVASYDESGRLISTVEHTGLAGINSTRLTGLANAPAGPIFVRVRATDRSGLSSERSTTLVRR